MGSIDQKKIHLVNHNFLLFYSKFKKISFDSNITLQKLVNPSVNKYIEDEEFRNEINNYDHLNQSGSAY